MKFLRSFKSPLPIIVFTAVLIPALYLSLCFPEVRAAFYPISACFSEAATLSIHPYSSTFTTNETPVFVISTESGHFFDCVLYAKEDLLKAFKREKNQWDRISPYPEISKAKLSKTKVPLLFKGSGVFVPLDQGHAEARVKITNQLAPGDYVAVFRSKSAFGENLDLAIARFRVTNIGALVKIDDYKAVIVVFDLISREIVRDVNIKVFLKQKDDDKALKLISSVNSGRNELIELDLGELVQGEPNVKERLVIDFSKAKHSAFCGDIKYSVESDFSIPLNVLVQNRHIQKHPKNRTFISLNCQGEYLNYFGQLTACTESGIKLPEEKQEIDFEIISPTKGVLLKEKVTTDESGVFSGRRKLDSDLSENGLKLIVSSDSLDEEIFDISKRAFQGSMKAPKKSKDSAEQYIGKHHTDREHTDESWFREFDSPSIQIDFDKGQYEADDSLEAAIKLSQGNKFPFFLVSLEGERLFQTKLIHVQSNPVKVSFKLDNETNPNIYLGLATVQKEHSPKAVVREVEMSLAGKKLKIIADGNRDDTESKAKIKVYVKDSDGRAVSGANVYACLPDKKALLVVSKSEGLSFLPSKNKNLFETLYAPLTNQVTTVYTTTAAENQGFTKYERFDFWGRSSAISSQLKRLPEMKNSSSGKGNVPNTDSKVNAKGNSTLASHINSSGAFLTSTTDENGEAAFNFQVSKEDREKVLTIFVVDHQARFGSLEKGLSEIM